jgi:hypothetical protein
MAEKITNEQMERLLLAFDWLYADDERYSEFVEYFRSTLLMVFHKYSGYTNGISDKGYEQVKNAYDELVSQDLDEITEEDIERIVRLYKDFGSTT